jgi:hypothetical protein
MGARAVKIVWSSRHHEEHPRNPGLSGRLSYLQKDAVPQDLLQLVMCLGLEPGASSSYIPECLDKINWFRPHLHRILTLLLTGS